MDHSQRFLCPSTPQSSPLGIGLRSRKRSRASSAGGNSLALTKELEKRGNDSCAESRAPKGKSRVVPGNLKKQQKHPRVNKPKAGNLRNAVVLAPFHTLKKSFQTKLINFYSLEKVKKMTYKTKMAKDRNLSFEYDIIELKPQVFPVKKEGKMTNKSNEKSKPISYCQCKKAREKPDKKLCENAAKRKRKRSGKELLASGAHPLARHLQSKRRRPNPRVVTPTALKTELGPGRRFLIPKGQSLMSEPYLSSSAMSSRSKGDSWETYSNCPSSKEEYTEGALAISSTSFDCYSDNFDKDGWEFSEAGRKCRKPEKNPRIPDPDGDFVEKQRRSSSRHLIMHVERKSSDGQILDFMDREPQTQVISSEESHQHLQPLRRQSRSKAKKPESESACGCHPRTHSSKARDTSRASSREWRSLCGNSTTRGKDLQIEVATQVEGDILQEDLNATQQNSSQRQVTEPPPDAHCEAADKTPEEHPNSNLFQAKLKESEPVDKNPNDAEESGRESGTQLSQVLQRPTTPEEPW